MKRLHLVCNAHLDPYWQWDWDEGAAAAISTYRTAADLCEEYGSFVFNHNEVILYRWIEEYEPALFKRIQGLVKAGKWHIMGGWYLQPDCNLPSGESFVRQILLGRTYFMEKFGVQPTTAINFDPFGHTRGLVQILQKTGYDSYLFCRPDQSWTALDDDDFIWVGFDGSEVAGHRVSSFYNSRLGEARAKVENWIESVGDREIGVILWGVGNHGGGPSRKDIEDLDAMAAETKDREIVHSTPELFFQERAKGAERPKRADDINPWGVGCYTSMVRVKQKHRQLENELYMTEKMASAASMQGLMDYPDEELREALRDLATSEFHDILPGSSIQPVEESALRLLYHGLELVSRVKTRALFALCSGQPKAAEDHIPVMIYNPHPFPVTGAFECEFQLADVHFEEQFTVPVILKDGRPIPCQVEKEHSNLSLDWRKRAIFHAELPPGQVSRFDSTFELRKTRPVPETKPENGKLTLKTDDLEVVINCTTGLVDKYAVAGRDMVKPSACLPIVMKDNQDPWGMLVRGFPEQAGEFTLMSPEESAAFAAVDGQTLEPVRVIEDGPVRWVVETSMKYGGSAILQTYRVPKQGAEVEVEVRVHWNEKDRLLKWSVPVEFSATKYVGQHAFGVQQLPGNGDEAVAQRWVAAVSEEDGVAVTCANDGTYGSDFRDGAMRMTLMRSPAYCAHPIMERPVVPQDRYTPRIDQGERIFRFWLNGGDGETRLSRIDREAAAHNEKPYALSFFPCGEGEMPKPAAQLDDDVVQMTAFKRTESGEGYAVRLFEPTGTPRATTLTVPALGVTQAVSLGGFEVKTFVVESGGKVRETNMLEQ